MNRTKNIAITAALALAAGLASAQLSTELMRQFEKADREVLRLSPAAFPELPRNLAGELRRRGCTIPQEYATKKPHNVIRGEFAKKGQTDWAVLCSRDRVSSILVFWNGEEKNPAELERMKDLSRLQGIGDDKIGYSRGIAAVGAAHILRHGKANGATPPPIDHQGIEDAFIEKASVIHYYYRGQWLKLLGAD